MSDTRIRTGSRVARSAQVAEHADFLPEGEDFISKGLVVRIVGTGPEPEAEVRWMGTGGFRTWVPLSELVLR